jgi:thioredoxin-dependent peroxiredoxin
VKFASRHTFIIDPAGKIAKVYGDVNPPKHSAEVLAELDQLQRQQAHNLVPGSPSSSQ